MNKFSGLVKWVAIGLLGLVSLYLVWFGFQKHAVKTPEVQQAISTTSQQAVTGPSSANVTVYSKATLKNGTNENSKAGKSYSINMSPDKMEKNYLLIPAIGVYAYIDTDGIMGKTVDGSLNMPNPTEVTRWVDGPNVTDSKGNTVLAGHVSWNNIQGALFHLADVKAGNLAYVKDSNGKVHTYKLIKLTEVKKSALPNWVWDKKDAKQLVVITCGGQHLFNGYHSYFTDNIIAVFAQA